MGLLQPESGLVFWMLLSFVIVFIVLARYGFPVIIKAIDSRKKYIDNSLDAAKEAEQKLTEIRTNGQKLLEAAEQQQKEIIREASETREQIIREARRKAESESKRIISAPHEQAAIEGEAILQEARNHVALLAVAISEKLLRQNLSDKEAQTLLAERLLNEMNQQANK